MSQAPSFDAFGLSPAVRQSLANMGYKEPTQVQIESIPPGIEGRDLVVQSRTGTGKTAAFGIPLIERIDLSKLSPQALVLCPTRELALQVHDEIARLGSVSGLRSCPIYGGASMKKQIDALRDGLHLVVGTPGRVLDHIRTRRFDLRSVRALVLDEADELLSMGFYEEVSRILEQIPRDRQTMLFSATMPPGVEGLIYRHQKEPVRLALSSDSMLVAEVHHAWYLTATLDKPSNLNRVLLHEEPSSAIIFVNTRSEARTVTSYLKREGFEAEMLSGELSQNDRERVMGMIKRAELRYMVATDVAARGIDISNLSHVVNYAVPENREVYVHRTGRTGRIGKSGTAITLVGLRELPRWGDIEKMKGLAMEERKLPTDDEILEKQVDRVIYGVRHLHAPKGPDDEATLAPYQPPEKFQLAAERLLEQGLDAQLLAFLLEKCLVPPESELTGRPTTPRAASQPQAPGRSKSDPPPAPRRPRHEAPAPSRVRAPAHPRSEAAATTPPRTESAPPTPANPAPSRRRRRPRRP